MDVVIPVTITQAMLTTNAAGTDSESEYSDGTTYAENDLVKVTGTASPTPVNEGNAIYRSVQSSNQGNDPTTDTLGTWWEKMSGTVGHEMFDGFESTQSLATTELDVEIEFSEIITTLGFLNIEGYQIQVIATSAADGEVYNTGAVNLTDDGDLIDEWEWCWSPIVRRKDYIVSDIPPYADLTIQVLITNDTGESAGCGLCIPGYPIHIGGTQWGASFGLLDFSLKERDETTGRTKLNQGVYAETGSFRIHADTQAVGSIRRSLIAARAIPALFIPTTQIDGTLLWAIMREWRVVYQNTDFSIFELDIEGLT